MMLPERFPGANLKLNPPKGYEDQVMPMYVFTNGRVVTSRWKVTSWKERILFLLTGSVWLQVWCGNVVPPVGVSVAASTLTRKQRKVIRQEVEAQLARVQAQSGPLAPAVYEAAKADAIEKATAALVRSELHQRSEGEQDSKNYVEPSKPWPRPDPVEGPPWGQKRGSIEGLKQ